MALSQSRTRSALKFVLSLQSVSQKQEWLKSRLTANGLSSSRLIRTRAGKEDATASQRVEFRIRTNADERMAQMLKLRNQ
jgi:outer membrane protein OmpA-like peptidoglycan-associated protein